MPDLATAKALKKLSMILGAICVIAVPFCRDDFKFIILPLLLLFLPLFPLYAGAILIMLTRGDETGQRNLFLMFKGLPPSAMKFGMLAWYLTVCFGIYIMASRFMGEGWVDLGMSETAMFPLVSFAFYLVSYGAYASVVIEKTNEAQQGSGQQPPASPESKAE